MTDRLPAMPKYESYKDSGVAWIGFVPIHWKLLKIKNIGNLVNGATPQSGVDRYWNGDITWVTPSDINSVVYLKKSERNITVAGYKSCGTTIIPPRALIITTRAPIGKVAISDTNLCTNQGCKSLVVSNNAISAFYYYFLSISSDLLNSLGTGTTFMELSSIEFKRFEIIYPPIPEQIVIAEFLDYKTKKIDQAITIKKKQINLLKERRQILIQTAVTQGLNPDAPMRDSGVEWIGKIPEHWEAKRIKYLFTEINKRTKTGIETLFSLRMEKGLLPHNDVSVKHIADENLINYKIISPGQMVMNRMRASIGLFGYANEFGLVSPDYAVFDIDDKASANYYLLMFKTKLLGVQFRLNSRGMGTGSSGFMRLYTENFGNIKVPMPSFEEQTAIVSYIQTQSAKIDKAITIQEQMIEKLKEYKTTLINSAVTGKIKVPMKTK